MAKDSSILDYQDVEQYANQLQQSADNIADTFNAIRQDTRDISEGWNDGQQVVLEELLQENARAIYALCQNLYDEGERVKAFCQANREQDELFKRKIQ